MWIEMRVGLFYSCYNGNQIALGGKSNLEKNSSFCNYGVALLFNNVFVKRILSLFLFPWPPHFVVDQIGEGVHDGVVFALVLEEGTVSLLGLHVAVLGGVAEGLGEDALGEDLWVGGLGHIRQLYVAAELVRQGLDHYTVGVSEVALVELVDPGNDLVQRVFLLGLGAALGLRCDVHPGFVPEADIAVEGLFQLIHFQPQHPLDVRHGNDLQRQHTHQEGAVHELPVQVLVEHADHLGNVAVPLAEVSHGAADLIAVVRRLLLVTVYRGEQAADQHALGGAALGAAGEIDLAEAANIRIVVDPIAPQLPLDLVEQIGVDLLLEEGLVVKYLEVLLNVFLFVGEVQDEGVVLAGAGPIEPGEGLHGLDAPELLVHDHGVQQGLVEAGLVLLRHNQNVEVVVELLLGLSLLDVAAVGPDVQPRLRVALVPDDDLPGESHHGLDLAVALFLGIAPDRLEIQHRGGSGGRNHHHLAPAVDLGAGGGHEGLHNDFGFLPDVLRVELLVLLDDLAGSGGGHLRVLRGGVGDLETGLVGHVVLQHVQDKALLDGLVHTVDMEGAEGAVLHGLAEHLQRRVLRRGGEGEEGQVLVLAVGQQLPDQLVLGVHLLLRHALRLSVFLQCVPQIRQGRLQLLGAGAGLRGVGFVADDGEVPALGSVHLFIDDRELLQGRDDDPCAVVDSVLQGLGGLVLADGLHSAQGVVKTGDRGLELGVQHPAVRDHDYAGKNRPVVGVMQGGQPIGGPGDGVGLAGACAVLDQIVVAGAVFIHVVHQHPHHVQLMKAGEDQPVALETDELLDNVHHAGGVEDHAPEVVRGIAIRVGRVALAAVLAGAVAAHVEGQEIRLISGQLGGHPGLRQIHAEEGENPLVELEADLLRVPVLLPLLLRVLHALPHELVFQLEGKDRDAVDRQEQIHAVPIVGAVMPLPDAVKDILPVVLCVGLIQAGFRQKVAHPKADAPVLEAVAQHVEHAVHVAGVVEGQTELPLRVYGVHIHKALPGPGLAVLNEADQGVLVQPQLRVVAVLTMGKPAFRRQEEGFNIAFKAFFCGIKRGHLTHLAFLC